MLCVLSASGDGGEGEGEREGDGEAGGTGLRSGPEQDRRGLCHRHGYHPSCQSELDQSGPTGWFPTLFPSLTLVVLGYGGGIGSVECPEAH